MAVNIANALDASNSWAVTVDQSKIEVPAVAAGVSADDNSRMVNSAAIITCVDKAWQFKISGLINKKSADMVPSYKDGFGKWIVGDPITGSKKLILAHTPPPPWSNERTYIRYSGVFATAEYKLYVQKDIFTSDARSFKGYFDTTTEGHKVSRLELECRIGK
jgi:hypothetical protein